MLAVLLQHIELDIIMNKLQKMIKEGKTPFSMVDKKMRIYHFPNVPCKPFYVEVDNELEAHKLMNVLAMQHLWLEKNNFIPDYSNAMGVEMWDEDLDADENGSKWTDYYNEEENCEFDDLESQFPESFNGGIVGGTDEDWKNLVK